MSYSYVDAAARERLYKEVDDVMVGQGFTADKPYWRRTGSGTIACLFIENYRSSYLFYISLGVYLAGLERTATAKPRLGDFHAWTRLTRLTGLTTAPQIALTQDGPSDRIIDEVIEGIKRVGLEVLADLSSIEGTKRVLEKYGETRWTIGPLLKERFYGSRAVSVPGELPLRDWEIAGSVNPYHKPKP